MKRLWGCAALGALAMVWGVPTRSAAAPSAWLGPLPHQTKSDQTTGPGGAAKPPTPEETQAYQAIQTELDPDKAVQMVDDFDKKFPNSALLSDIYFFAANAYRQKKDLEKGVDYGEKSLKRNGDNLRSLLFVADMETEPAYIKNHQMDQAKILSEAEGYANHALELVAKFQKAANLTDEQFNQQKTLIAGLAHSTLGMVHLNRALQGLAGPDAAELGKAEEEFKAAVSSGSRPDAGSYYRLGEIYTMENKIDEAIDAFTKAGEADPTGQIKSYADDQIGKLKKKKAEQKPATKP